MLPAVSGSTCWPSMDFQGKPLEAARHAVQRRDAVGNDAEGVESEKLGDVDV